MWDLLKAFGHFYIYSSVHIAICAGLLTTESYLLLQLPIDLHVVLFITFSTMSVYSLHRLVGMSKVKAYEDQGRYKLIKKYKQHILIYFIISSIASGYYFLHLPFSKMQLLLIPGLLTLAYVLPVLKSRKRLRDLPLIKIFLIAFVWTWLTLFLPTDYARPTLLFWMAIERILFFLAITIPFDIRDLEVDSSIGVKTLVHQLGVKKSRLLAILFLLIGLILIIFMLAQMWITTPMFLGLLVTYLLCAMLIILSNEQKGDWFFGGLLDGTIGLRIIFIILFVYILQ